jgi:hypothetical protein
LFRAFLSRPILGEPLRVGLSRQIKKAQTCYDLRQNKQLFLVYFRCRNAPCLPDLGDKFASEIERELVRFGQF